MNRDDSLDAILETDERTVHGVTTLMISPPAFREPVAPHRSLLPACYGGTTLWAQTGARHKSVSGYKTPPVEIPGNMARDCSSHETKNPLQSKAIKIMRNKVAIPFGSYLHQPRETWSGLPR